MDSVSVFDAKNKLSALLDRVERGEAVSITRRGVEIARLVPVVPVPGDLDLIAKARALREEISAQGGSVTTEELLAYKNEGRR